MSALFGYGAVGEHDDSVGALDGGEPVCDDDGGAAVADRDFLRAVDVEVLQLSLELVVGRLEVEERLRLDVRREKVSLWFLSRRSREL